MKQQATRESPGPVEQGGLISYSPDSLNVFRRAAHHVARILKGAKPAELPVELPTTYEMVIKIKAAKALALRIPQSVMLQATRVIE